MKSKAVIITLAVAGLTIFGAAAPASAATTWTVCASGCDSTTIQGAVTAAAPGDTINVAAGTYTEVVTLDKDGLILRGAGAGVDARTRSSAETILLNGQFVLSAENLSIDGFTFDDSENPPTTTATAIIGSAISGTQILNNIIENGLQGVVFNNPGPAPALVKNNVFKNNTNSGIQTGNSKNISIIDNAFSGNATAIDVLGENIGISGNTSTGDKTFVVVTDSTNVQISGNVMNDATDGSGIFLGLGNDGVTISGNSLDSNAIPSDGTSAIRISTVFGGPAHSKNYTITGNTITGGWSHAIRTSSDAYDGVLAPRGNEFRMIVTNGETDPAKVIDARENFWDPAIDLTPGAMPNVLTGSPCVNEDCSPAAAAPTGPVLAATGADSVVPLSVSTGIVLLGLALLIASRRRRARLDRA